MTPAERTADYREELALLRRNSATNFRLGLEDIAALLALAEAVPERLDMGHNDSCWRGQEGGLCTCGHDALAAAWAALGDDHE